MINIIANGFIGLILIVMRIKITAALVLMFFTALPLANAEKLYIPESMYKNPEWYIKVSDWSLYSTWSAVAIIHSVTIENTSDVEYKNVKVRVSYTSTAAGGAGNVVSQETGVLPVTLPPRSKNTYLKAGVTLGAGSAFMNPTELQVLGATPVLN